MANPPPAWTRTALMVLLPLAAILLAAQYILGLLTNLYAPAGGFTSNSDFGYLDGHYDVGYSLGIVTLLLVIVTALTRQMRLIGPAVIVFAFVAIAGVAGMAFVNTVPNPPTASLTMGISFLIAFGALTQLGYMLRSGPMMGRGPALGSAVPPPASPSS